MKRDRYIILLNGTVIATKYAWNSASREIERLVGDIAKDYKTTFRLTGILSTRGIDNSFETGYREWTGDNGIEYKFEIIKNYKEN